MKRPGYRRAIEWIASNDEPTELEADEMDGLISVVLVADLFDIESARVAADVVKLRRKLLGHQCETCGAEIDAPNIVCGACGFGEESNK